MTGFKFDIDHYCSRIYFSFQNITRDTTCLCISDGSLLPLIAARLGAKHVYTIETNHMCNRVINDFIKHNKLQDCVTILDKMPEDMVENTIPEKVNVIEYLI